MGSVACDWDYRLSMGQGEILVSKEETVDLKSNSEGVYEPVPVEKKTRKVRKTANPAPKLFIPIAGIRTGLVNANVSISKDALTPIAFGLAAHGFIAGFHKTLKQKKWLR